MSAAPAPAHLPAPRQGCCQRCRRQLALHRAGALRDAAARESEETLLRAAVWLEARAARSSDPALFLEAALHYLVLAEHPDVLDQPGLAGRYLARADAWLARAGSTEVPAGQRAALDA